MAIVSMAYAVAGLVASSAEYNKVVDNVNDLDARLGAVVSGSSAKVRLDDLETLTTNTATNGGHGNVQLSTRLGTGVTTASTATAQFATLTTRTTDVSTGNTALGSRVSALEALSGGAAPFIHAKNSASGNSITGSTHASQSWQLIVLDTSVEARGGSFDNAGDYITVTSAGLYQVIYYVPFQNVANPKAIRLDRYTSGAWSAVSGSSVWIDAVTAPGIWPVAEGSKFVRLAAGDRVRISAWAQTTTSIVNEGTDSASQDEVAPHLQVLYVAS